MKVRGRMPMSVPLIILAVATPAAGLGGYFAFKWATTDEQDVYGSCSRGSGTCLQGGETLNMVMGLVFGGLGLAGILVAAWLIVRLRRRAAADALLVQTGRTGVATVTSVQETGSVTRTNGRVTSQGYRLELDPGDGGEPLVIRVTLPPGLQPGARVRVAYDPVTRDAALLETPRSSPTGNLFAPG
jgi:hypothetical protein